MQHIGRCRLYDSLYSISINKNAFILLIIQSPLCPQNLTVKLKSGFKMPLNSVRNTLLKRGQLRAGYSRSTIRPYAPVCDGAKSQMRSPTVATIRSYQTHKLRLFNSIFSGHLRQDMGLQSQWFLRLLPNSKGRRFHQNQLHQRAGSQHGLRHKVNGSIPLKLDQSTEYGCQHTI